MTIPKPITNFIRATNNHNTREFLASFTQTAVISDEGRDYAGIEEIEQWSNQNYIGAKVTLEPVKSIPLDNKTLLTARVDGSFDKTGLPDPFLLQFLFIIESNKISKIRILLPEPGHTQIVLDSLRSWPI